MTHIHVAIYKWKPGTSQSTVEKALEMVRRVADRVPGVRAIYCGTNTSRWAEGYTEAVVVIGDTAAAIDAYRSDRGHVDAAAIIDAMEDAGVGVDFQDPAG
jgi:hypothetical protein